ncbi:hypothetical protein V1477_010057 [Vespula maculifrons]|uniref:Uncharacterized protein n=2 Tax=Vespula TaxID=7451 RepID=A0A834K149_VESVU|nr:hypothetical protein HZH66_007581 [Vespula vulgaris]
MRSGFEILRKFHFRGTRTLSVDLIKIFPKGRYTLGISLVENSCMRVYQYAVESAEGYETLRFSSVLFALTLPRERITAYIYRRSFKQLDNRMHLTDPGGFVIDLVDTEKGTNRQEEVAPSISRGRRNRPSTITSPIDCQVVYNDELVALAS